MTNPLFQTNTLPAFSKIKHQHILSAVKKQLEENKNYIQNLIDTIENPEWHNFVEPIAVKGDELSKLWSPVSHMNSVVSNDEFREQHDACLPLLSQYSSELGQNKALYEAYKKVSENDALSSIQKKIISDELLDFHLAGVDLDEKNKKRFREIKSRLSELASSFSNHVLDATMAWTKHFPTKEGLEGLPDSALATAFQAAKDKELKGYLLTLEIPSYLAVMTYAEDANLRKEVYRAYSTRASDKQNHPEWDNQPVIEETLALRKEMSVLLGYKNYAEYSLATKMAENTDQVLDFLNQLADYSFDDANKEFEELTDFAKSVDGTKELKSWDVAYYSEKLREQKYDLSQEALRPYFPEHQVLKGLFEITSKLYGVSFQENRDIDVWHADVKYYEIFDANKKQLGGFYLDLYARGHKRGGAWMDSCRDRMIADGLDQLPVAYLTCNFNGPVDGKPALFTHDEVVTLFHEFGHGLHHLMTQIDDVHVSGINGVSWDAVELPSQFMENFCYEKESLSLIARHVDTGQPLDDDSLERLNEARKFQAAMQMVRQLEFALFDFRLHLEFDENIEGQIREILEAVRNKVAVVKPPEWNRFENGFSHIFAGGYAAGYYSYKWAEVLSADVWEAFLDEGIFNPETGHRFLDCILSKGGSDKAMALFVDFRGREPSVEPLLDQQGINWKKS